MMARIWDQVSWHAATARHIAGAATPWVLTVPVLGILVIYALSTLPAVAPYLTKDSAEIISPIILAVALVLAVFAYVTRSAQPYFAWQVLLAFALFLRELHFEGTNTGFYIAFVLLLVWASYARERLEPYFSDIRIVSLIVAMIWTYLVSKTFDRHMWNHVLPAGTDSNLFEENLEVVGHLLCVVLVATSFLVEGAPIFVSPQARD